MDRRNEELVFLKKTYRREKRSATGFWKFSFTVSLLVLLFAIPSLVLIWLPRTAAASWIGFGLDRIYVLLGIGMPQAALVGLLGRFSNILLILTGIFLLMFLLSVLMWVRGSSRLKRTDAFLSYRTLREALREEKKYQQQN